ncbi:Clathrin interactor 1 [Balamuthia mandrillaris]
MTDLDQVIQDPKRAALNVWRKGKDAVMNTPEMEIKVREATSNVEWGPSTTQMGEIAAATFQYHQLPIVMHAIWARIHEAGRHWRHIYKSLLLLEYILRHGSEQAIRDIQAHSHQLQRLTHYHLIDSKRVDRGQTVRQRTKALLELLQDSKRLKEERAQAKKNRDKYTGHGSDSSGLGGGNYYSDTRHRDPRFGLLTVTRFLFLTMFPIGTISDISRRDAYQRRGTGDKKHNSDDDSDSLSDDQASDSGYFSDEEPSASEGTATPAKAGSTDSEVPPKSKGTTTSELLLSLFDEPAPTASPSLQTSFPGQSMPAGVGVFTATPSSILSNARSAQPTAFPSATSTAPASFDLFDSLNTTPSVPAQSTSQSVSTGASAEGDWDSFVKFEDTKSKDDLWSKHQNLFDLQHLNISDKPKGTVASTQSQHASTSSTTTVKSTNTTRTTTPVSTKTAFGGNAWPHSPTGLSTLTPSIGGSGSPIYASTLPQTTAYGNGGVMPLGAFYGPTTTMPTPGYPLAGYPPAAYPSTGYPPAGYSSTVYSGGTTAWPGSTTPAFKNN